MSQKVLPARVVIEPVPEYKREMIDFLIQKGSLTITPASPRTLKSKRQSPHFLNSGMLDDGESVIATGKAYARASVDKIGADNFDVIFGPPYKGIPLATMTAAGLQGLGVNKKYAFYRKEEKTHGEGTSAGETKAEAQKRLIVGVIADGARVILVDDVVTTGGTKVEAAEILKVVANDVKVQGGVILLDRQELNEQGEAALEKLARDTTLRFHPVLKMSDVVDRLGELGPEQAGNRKAILDYSLAWGTPEIRNRYGLYQEPLIAGRTLIPACDVASLDRFEEIVKVTGQMEGIGGFKIPALSGRKGWETWVTIARRHTQKPLIFDGQKWGNDIPDTGRDIMREVKAAGFDAVILFPFTGPNTQVAWTGEAIQAGLTVLLGAEMTHPGFLQSEGGTIPEAELQKIFIRGAKQGVRNYVYPGNKPNSIATYIDLIRGEGIEPTGFSPGFLAQGGKISDAANAAGDTDYHAIVGRGIYEAKDIEKAARELVRSLGSQ